MQIRSGENEETHYQMHFKEHPTTEMLSLSHKKQMRLRPIGAKGSRPLISYYRSFVAMAIVYSVLYSVFSMSTVSKLGTNSASLPYSGAHRVPKIEETNAAKTKNKIQVFYNLFIQGPEDEERVKMLVEEQLAYFDPKDSQYHEEILVTSIGHPPSNFTHGTIREHTDTGSEALTLHAIWEYCKAHPHHEQKVVYLHSKGSYHDTSENKRLRPFITRGALSKECSNLPDKCNVCSSRMSPLPHPYTSGNMWLARCDYISELIDPTTDFISDTNDYPKQFAFDNPCKGWGRAFLEHWVHSHPSVSPCDLYKGDRFFYGYRNVPDATTFEIDLQMATERFPGGFKQGLYNGICGRNLNGFTEVKSRIWQYETLYHEKPDESWWGWKFYNVTFEDAKNKSIV